ncbi:MAG: glycosyltransferase family 39 protein [Actinomycetia bacterium]|nr:glycosyltransferase family 39 protein [Actinomycetes bacterium]
MSSAAIKLTYRQSVVGAVAASIALRARFLFAPLLADEGGILSVARDWSSGATLYRNVWIDRPQGLIVLFRGWDALPGTGVSSTRMLAVLLGAIAVAAVASVGRSLFSARVGAIAAWFTAALTASPLLEGFASNGELLSAAFAISALAIVAAVMTVRCPLGWLLAAGLLFGAALAVKQSAFDVLLAVIAWLALAMLLGWQTRRRLLASAGMLGLGMGVVLGACAWHGSTLGWSDYWYAVAGFRLEARSALSNPELDKLAISVLFIIPVMVPAFSLVVRAGRSLNARSLRRRPHAALVLLWSVAATFSFVTGGSFHRHYFIILAFPLAVLAAVAVDKLGSAGMLHSKIALGIAIAAAMPFIANPRLILGDVTDTNVELASWLDEQQALRGPLTVYAYCADAALYTQIGQTPPFRYLWEDHVRLAQGAQGDLLQLLTGPNAPEYVLRLQPLDQCDESGTLAAAIERGYVSEGEIGEAEVLRRIDLAPAAG